MLLPSASMCHHQVEHRTLPSMCWDIVVTHWMRCGQKSSICCSRSHLWKLELWENVWNRQQQQTLNPLCQLIANWDLYWRNTVLPEVLRGPWKSLQTFHQIPDVSVIFTRALIVNVIMYNAIHTVWPWILWVKASRGREWGGVSPSPAD